MVTARTPAVPSGRLAEVAITCPDRQPSVASAAAAASTALRQQVSGAGRSYRMSVGEALLFGLLMMWVAVLAGTTLLGFPAVMAAASALTGGPVAVVGIVLRQGWVRSLPVDRLPANQVELVSRAVWHHLEVAAAADATALPELRTAVSATQHGLWELAALVRRDQLTDPATGQRIADQLEVVAGKARETRRAHAELVDATSPPGTEGGGPFVGGRLVVSLARTQAAGQGQMGRALAPRRRRPAGRSPRHPGPRRGRSAPL